MTSNTEKQVIIMHILASISRSKDNQAIKFSHLIAYKVRNIVFQKSCRKFDRKTSPRPSFKKKNLHVR